MEWSQSDNIGTDKIATFTCMPPGQKEFESRLSGGKAARMSRSWGELKLADDDSLLAPEAIEKERGRPRVNSKGQLEEEQQSVNSMPEGPQKQEAQRKLNERMAELGKFHTASLTLKRSLSNDLLRQQNWGKLKKMDKSTLVKRVKAKRQEDEGVSSGHGVTTSDNFVDEKHVHISAKRMAFDAAVEAERHSWIPFVLEAFPYVLMVSRHSPLESVVTRAEGPAVVPLWSPDSGVS